ncbi:transglycosylase family protein [Mycolicibacter terrae]|uniref:transglycosylase family protein n=1 Tax=Mycolicibacter terrae TaxID=1788 RepID=UPI000A148129|nr:transglycosylase family protein [Mycolicibacter terrae]ORW96394.1 resuscitation-promoting factor-like protein [Mycolicibacter terrae]SNV66304.1 resuscitation-promoting factor-like protein [Mycolicibacter terrae]
MRKFTVLAVAALLAGAAELTGAANADPINWEAIAKCESGGDWAADSGNGDYGGLQISAAAWDANGGVGLPSQASPQQQIAVAKRIMADQGPGAWPTCASRGSSAATGAGAAPVGSLTHYLSALFADADGLDVQAY